MIDDQVEALDIEPEAIRRGIDFLTGFILVLQADVAHIEEHQPTDGGVAANVHRQSGCRRGATGEGNRGENGLAHIIH